MDPADLQKAVMTTEFYCTKNPVKFGKTALNPIYGFLVAFYPNHN